MQETIDGYDLLCNAIILQAIKDYKHNPTVKKSLVKQLDAAKLQVAEAMVTGDMDLIKNAETHRDMIQFKIDCIYTDQKNIEKFFRSGWYRMMTKVDGDVILDYLHKVVHE